MQLLRSILFVSAIIAALSSSAQAKLRGSNLKRTYVSDTSSDVVDSGSGMVPSNSSTKKVRLVSETKRNRILYTTAPNSFASKSVKNGSSKSAKNGSAKSTKSPVAVAVASNSKSSKVSKSVNTASPVTTAPVTTVSPVSSGTVTGAPMTTAPVNDNALATVAPVTPFPTSAITTKSPAASPTVSQEPSVSLSPTEDPIASPKPSVSHLPTKGPTASLSSSPNSPPSPSSDSISSDSPTGSPSSSPTPFWKQVGASIEGVAANDESGSSVSLSNDGKTVAVGSPHIDPAQTNAGHTRILRWDGSQWAQLGADINGDGGGGGGLSGFSVSLSDDGNTVAVGDPTNNGGHTRVLSWNGTNWSQLGSSIDGENTNELFGWSVSLSNDGNTVAVGSPFNFGNGVGHTRVFGWDGSKWAQLGSDIVGEATNDQSGYSVSLSGDGNTVATGAPNADHTRIFRWDGSQWAQFGSDINGEDIYQSGFSVSLSDDGNTVAIGAPYSNAGHTQVFSWDGSKWAQLGSDIDGEDADDQSGFSVSLSGDGNTLAVGSLGHTRIFMWDGSNWAQLGSNINGENDDSGSLVSLSGDGSVVAIGAIGSSSFTGNVRIFS